MIGELLAERLSCGDEHLPGCYNPNSQDTYCICGAVQWPGQVGTWHSRMVRPPAAPDAKRSDPEPKVVGWDTYFLHAPDCPRRTADLEREPCRPRCGGAA